MGLIKRPWVSPLNSLPADDLEVWVKISIYQFADKGTYSSSTQSFTFTASGLVIPWYFVWAWRTI